MLDHFICYIQHIVSHSKVALPMNNKKEKYTHLGTALCFNV